VLRGGSTHKAHNVGPETSSRGCISRATALSTAQLTAAKQPKRICCSHQFQQ
jgi:hypothetical protein